MLTWDEARAAVKKAQSLTAEDFEKHLADHMVQGVLDKLIDDYVAISLRRRQEADPDLTLDEVSEIVPFEAAIFMTGVQVGWYMAEGAFSNAE